MVISDLCLGICCRMMSSVNQLEERTMKYMYINNGFQEDLFALDDKYTPQKILRATILFSVYRNVKTPKLNPYLMDTPKDAE